MFSSNEIVMLASIRSKRTGRLPFGVYQAIREAYDPEYQKQMNEARATLKAALMWTSIEHELPALGVEVLVNAMTDNGPFVSIAHLDRKGEWIHEGEYPCKRSYWFHITHWAPKPEAFEAEVSTD